MLSTLDWPRPLSSDAYAQGHAVALTAGTEVRSGGLTLSTWCVDMKGSL